MKNANLILFLLNLVCFISACIWWAIDGGFEPMIASITFLATLIGQMIVKETKSKVKMQQKAGKGSVNYQSGRDININSDVK